MQMKIGAYLANIMVKNLKFRCGNNKYMLLKPELLASKNKIAKGASVKKLIGTITINKAFTDEFVSQLDK